MGSSRPHGAIGSGSQSGRCLAAPSHPSSKRSIITRLNILCRGRAAVVREALARLLGIEISRS